MTELPKGWVETTFQQCLAQKTGKVDPKEFPKSPYLAMDDIESNTGKLLSHKLGENFKSACAQYTQGDILYGRLRPYLNKVMRAPFDGLASAELLVYTSTGAMNLNYAERVLRSKRFLDYAAVESTGDRPRLSPAKLAEFPVSLPPLKEQKRIVEKLDSLTASSREAATALTNVEALIERYRAAVLRYHFLPLEESVEIIRLQEACESLSDGDHQAPPKVEKGIPFITISSMNTGEINLGKVTRYVPKEYYQELNTKRRPQKGDVLYSVTGSFGIPALVKSDAQFVFQRHIAIMRPKHDKVSSEFLELFLRSPGSQRYAQDAATGTAQKTVSLTKLRAMPFPLPRMDQQLEIVSLIRTAFLQIEVLSAAVLTARTRLEALDRSMLDKAFKGKLVHQDPNDEPAGILLERIKAEKKAAAAKDKKKKTTVAKASGGKAMPSEIRTIPKMTISETVEKVLTEGPKNGITFEDLNQVVSGSYDDVKDAVFEMLGGGSPKIKQKFDEQSKIMRLLKA